MLTLWSVRHKSAVSAEISLGPGRRLSDRTSNRWVIFRNGVPTSSLFQDHDLNSVEIVELVQLVVCNLLRSLAVTPVL